jgi:hypothetical protein
MRSLHHRTLKVFIAAAVLALAAGSTAAAAVPAAQSNKKTTPCTLGQTFRYLPDTAPRTLTVKTGSANIRKLPGVDCPIVTKAGKGTKLNGTGKNAQLMHSTSKWTQVKVQVHGQLQNLWIAITQVR